MKHRVLSCLLRLFWLAMAAAMTDIDSVHILDKRVRLVLKGLKWKICATEAESVVTCNPADLYLERISTREA